MHIWQWISIHYTTIYVAVSCADYGLVYGSFCTHQLTHTKTPQNQYQSMDTYTNAQSVSLSFESVVVVVLLHESRSHTHSHTIHQRCMYELEWNRKGFKAHSKYQRIEAKATVNATRCANETESRRKLFIDIFPSSKTIWFAFEIILHSTFQAHTIQFCNRREFNRMISCVCYVFVWFVAHRFPPLS